MYVRRGLLKMIRSRKLFQTICCLLLLFIVFTLFDFPINLYKTDSDYRGTDLHNVSQTSNNYSPCPPKTNIMFLKVHKAGSSTIFNVLGRFVINNKLNMAIPNKKSNTTRYNYLGDHSYLTKEMVLPLPEGQRYNIFFNHVVYNRTFFDMILPQDTFYFAIVRDPEERFLSAAKYYGFVNTLSKKDPNFTKTPFVFENFLTDPSKFGYSTYGHIHNDMAHDFGVPKTHFNNKQFVKEYLENLDREFNLVLLMEYFDESLIMLRRKLCWTLKDVLYLKQNAGSKPKKKIVLTDSDRDKLKEFQSADVMIYNHFQKRFWNDLNSFGIEIHQETNYFKDVRRRMESFCSSYTHLKDKFITIDKSSWNSPFNVTILDCNILTTPELRLFDKIKSSLIQKLNKQKPNVGH